MKRALSLLLAAGLSLAACGGQTPPDAPAAPTDGPGSTVEPEPASAPIVPVTLDALRVEFVTGERDVDGLLALQSEFPQALIDALGAQQATVGSVSVTFGTSDEATATALRNGAVDIGFLAAETALTDGQTLFAAEQGGEPDVARSAVVLGRDWPEAATPALRAALEALEPVLAHYTGAPANGAYTCDAAYLEQLRLPEEPEE